MNCNGRDISGCWLHVQEELLPGSTTRPVAVERTPQAVDQRSWYGGSGVPCPAKAGLRAPVVGTFSIGAGLCHPKPVFAFFDHPAADQDVVRRQDVTLVVRLAAQAKCPARRRFRGLPPNSPPAPRSITVAWEALILNTLTRIVWSDTSRVTAPRLGAMKNRRHLTNQRRNQSSGRNRGRYEEASPRRRPAGSNANGA